MTLLVFTYILRDIVSIYNYQILFVYNVAIDQLNMLTGDVYTLSSFPINKFELFQGKNYGNYLVAAAVFSLVVTLTSAAGMIY